MTFCKLSYFPFWLEGWIWVLIASVPGLCIRFTFMTSLSGENQANIIEAFKTSRYLDDLLNIDNSYFEEMVKQIYPPELKLNKAKIQLPRPPFLTYI